MAGYPAVEAVLFDLDNTLYPYDPCHEAGTRAALQESRALGYDMDRDAFDRFYAAGRRETKRELSGTAAAHKRLLYFKRALELRAGPHRGDDALALTAAYWDAYIDEMALVPGVTDTLTALADSDVQIAVTTNLSARVQLRKIHALGIADSIDHVLTGEEVGAEKPSAVMFTEPLTRLDVRPSDALMVGDSLAADIAGGNAMGIETVLFNNTYDPDRHPAAQEPDHTVDTIAAVQQLAGIDP